MYKYLIADYLLGYALSADDYFTAAEAAVELMTSEKVIRPVLETILRENAHWFDVKTAGAGSSRQYLRNPEYDQEIVAWLKEGRSEKLFRQEKLALQPALAKGRSRTKMPAAVKILKLAFAIILQFRKKRRSLPQQKSV